MAKQRAVLAAMAVGVIGVVAAGLWMVMSDPAVAPDGETGKGPAQVEPGTTKTPAPDDETGKRSRTKKSGGKYAAAVFGEVRLRRGDAPAAGQEVVIRGDDKAEWTAVCGAAGAFRVADLPPGGPYELSVTAPDCATVVLPGLMLDRKEERDVGTLVLDAAVRLEVVVRNYADTPIQGALVSAYPQGNARTNPQDWLSRMAQAAVAPVAVATADTDAEGRAIFPKLATGSWVVVATKEGRSRASQTTPMLRSDSDPEPVTLYMGTGHSLTGKVLDQDDKPISAAIVLAGDNANMWDMSGQASRARTETDAEGHYALKDLPAGDTQVFAARPGGMPVQVASLRVPDVQEYVIHVRSGGVLEGTVTDETTGKPLGEVEVRAQSYSRGWQIATATTDAAGKYVIDTLLEGPVNQVTATRSGWSQVVDPSQQAWSQTPLNAGDVVVRDIQMRPAATVVGRVLGPDGAPLAGAFVTAWSSNGSGSVDQKHGRSDTEGAFRVEGVSKGRCVLQVAREGYYQKGFPQNVWMVVQQGGGAGEWTVEVPEQGEVEKDISLVAGNSIEGRVENEQGEGLAGAKVTAFGMSSVSAETGTDGTFRIEGVRPAPQVAVQATKDGYAPQNANQPMTEDEPLTDVVIVLHTARIVRGVITSASSTPLEDAYVQAQVTGAPGGGNGMPMPMPVSGRMGGQNWSNARRAPVNPDGTYEIEVLGWQGRVVVHAVAAGHEARDSAPIDLVDGRTEYEANVELTLGYTVQGRVVGKGTGQAIPSAEVRISAGGGGRVRGGRAWTNFGPMEGGNQGTIVAITNARGEFKVEHVSEGKLSASATADGFTEGSQSFQLPGAGTVEIELAPALDVAGVVQLTGSDPVQGAMVSIQKAGGNEQNMGFSGMGGNQQAMTGSDGRFVIRNVAEGMYEVTVQPAWGSVLNIRAKKVENITAGRSDVVITVEQGLGIAGTLLGPDGKPIAGVQLNAQPQQQNGIGMMWRIGRSGADGKFEILGLDAGAYNVNVQTQWSPAADLQSVTKEGVPAGTTNLEIRLLAGLEISGKLVDGDGKPKTDVMLMAQPAGPRDRGGGNSGGQGTVEADGSFTIRGLSSGEYNISLQNMYDGNQGGVLQGGQKVAAGTTGLRLVVSEGVKISGSVVGPGGAPIANANVRANPKEGGRGANGRSDANGDFTITGLADGARYTISANAQGLVSASLEDVAAGSAGLRIELSEGLSVSGTYLDGAGKERMEAMVFLQGKDRNQRGSGVADADGKFTITGLAPGEYTVRVYVAKESDGDSGNGRSQQGEWVDVATVQAGDTNVQIRRP